MNAKMQRRPGPNPKPLTRAEALAAELLADDERKAVTIEREQDMRIGASIPVALIRRAYEIGGEEKALAEGFGCFIEGTITRDQILGVATGKATLRGFSDTGITYHDKPCTRCNGEGRAVMTYAEAQGIAAQLAKPRLSIDHTKEYAQREAMRTGRIRCPSCNGDGFAGGLP